MTQSFKEYLDAMKPDEDMVVQAARYYLAERSEDLPAEDMIEHAAIAGAGVEPVEETPHDQICTRTWPSSTGHIPMSSSTRRASDVYWCAGLHLRSRGPGTPWSSARARDVSWPSST